MSRGAFRGKESSTDRRVPTDRQTGRQTDQSMYGSEYVRTGGQTDQRMEPSSDGEDASVNGSLIWRCSRCTGLNIKEHNYAQVYAQERCKNSDD